MSHYTIYVTPEALQEIKKLPGNVRQRIRRTVRDLGENPRPPSSKLLNVPAVEAEVRRLRLDNWRILYAIAPEDKIIDLLAVRKRPPYNYEDLQTLLTDFD